MDAVFPKTETATFPHWLQAGADLAEAGVTSVAAGVYGEVVGGQYSGVMPTRGLGKAIYMAKMLLRDSPIAHTPTLTPPSDTHLETIRELLCPQLTTKPWYLTQEVWHAALSQAEAVTADARWTLDRLVARGAFSQDQLIEGFLLEHLAAQHTGEQAVSCRASIDVTMPFTDAGLLQLAASLPMALKVQNSLDRLMLLRHAPALTRFATAATLVPARAPMIVQEASRVVRRISDSNRWRLHFLSKGAVPFPRPSWWQLEFLRDGALFYDLLDDLKSDMWDRSAIKARIAANAQALNRRQPEWRSPTALLSQHLLRIATIDRLVR